MDKADGGADRLATLNSYGILDTPPEPDFDDIARLAAQICSASSALITFIDDARQFFKARVGFDGDVDSPLEAGFCPDVVRAGEAVVITDTQADLKPANIPGTVFADVRFYAGVPLLAPDGQILGTLCVLDRVPRPEGITRAQRGALEALARQVVAQLELRRAVKEHGAALSRQAAEHSRHRQVVNSATEFAIVATDREGRVTDWNTGAERVFGWAAGEMIGSTAERFFTPEDREAGQVDREMTGALRDGRGVDERWHLRADGSRFWASGEMMPLRDEDGSHIGFIKIARDRTEQHLAGVRLQDLEAQLRQAQEAGGIGLFTVEVATGILTATPEMSQLFGHEHRERRPAQDFERLVLPDDQALVSNNSTRRAGGSLRDVEYRIRRADTGELRWIARKGEFRFDEAGAPVRFAGVARDITDRKTAELQLAESSERQRLALAIGDVGTFDLDLSTGDLILDERARAAFGIQDRRAVGQAAKLGAVHPDDKPAFDAAFGEAMAGKPFDLQFRTIGIDDGVVRWVAFQGRVLDGSRFIGAARDVSEHVAADERRALLNRELSHRLKNTLAVVQSIVAQTLRTTSDPIEARKVLSERIQTLSRAHDILLSGERDAGSLDSIVRSAVELHDAGDQLRLSGPDILIGPKAALTLALVCHELATNAGKYGALSVPDGGVDVTWSIDGDPVAGTQILALVWVERGGPAVTPPARRGFGTRLITMGFGGSGGGSVDLDYDPAGLRCRIVAPLAELQDEE